MRFSHYKMINELYTSVAEAVDYMEQSGNYAVAGDCLSALGVIAETLEDGCGEIPGDLFDNLLKFAEQLATVAETGGDMTALARLSEKIGASLKNDLKYRLRVLFVAELGSKWDSMASVYEEFMRRGDCDVDVVLEPIFRATKNPDGTVRSEVIYDDWLTPLGISHTPYNAYDFSSIQPDITFISQPYETVTIPMFWPENIAKYSNLVYVPYFTVKDLMGDNRASFFELSTQKFAWRIVCQSETMKEHYKKFASRQGENVIVTGIPKWDYPFKLNEDSVKMPLEWKDKISGKKVFLWNTHFVVDSAPSKILETGMDFLNVFKERDDIALIWRPHPMTEPVLKVYSPKGYEIFDKLCRSVENSENMVLDTQQDYSASFVYSDALITDRSSIIDQYVFMKKPILQLAFSEYGEMKKIAADGLFDYTIFRLADTLDERIAFINDVVDGKESGEELGKKIVSKYYKYADGKVGVRVAEKIISEFLKEAET